MAKPKSKPAPPPVDRPPPPAPPTEGAPTVTPKGIADDFKAAVAAVEQEQGVQLKPTARATTLPTPGAPSAPVPGIAPAPTWTPSGIGRAGVHLVNGLLAMGDHAELEPEEESGLAEDVAYYLSVRWPAGSAWEPELRLGARAVEVIAPRLAARRKLLKEQALDKEADEVAGQGDRTEKKAEPGGERKKAELVPVIPASPMTPPPVIPRKEDEE